MTADRKPSTPRPPSWQRREYRTAADRLCLCGLVILKGERLGWVRGRKQPLHYDCAVAARKAQDAKRVDDSAARLAKLRQSTRPDKLRRAVVETAARAVTVCAVCRKSVPVGAPIVLVRTPPQRPWTPLCTTCAGGGR